MIFRWMRILWVVLAMNTVIYAQNDSGKPKHLMVFPVVARSIETGWSFGTAGSYTFHLSKQDTVSRTSNLQLLLLYSAKKQLVTAINGSQYFDKEKYIVNEQISFSSYPDKFWGIGTHTPDNAEEPYQFKQYYVYLHVLRKLAPHLFAGLLFEMQKVWKVTYQAGGLFEQLKVPGRDGYLIAGLGASLTYDKRNNAFAPDNGVFCQFSFNHFDKILGSQFNYTNFVLDLRKYFPIFSKQVLALQFFSFNNTGEVPVRSLASFGGANKMRGYYEGRYKDMNQLVIQGEYRFPVYKRFSAVAFAGGGNVSNQLRDYSLNDFKFSYGGGIRFALNKKEKLNLRIDYGIGQGKNNGFYLQLGEVF
ncbi:MAG: outer membrane protein assembly factor [Chitinophagaceae bacterium]|nr:outer membrane protein assembly factor [Chitinophagaceae bacterium]MDP3666432.1 BamA/TamA family outer membrane protein [Sediminibacterium sp.]